MAASTNKHIVNAFSLSFILDMFIGMNLFVPPLMIYNFNERSHIQTKLAQACASTSDDLQQNK